MFNCPHCGRQLPDDSVFCEGCGQSVSKYSVMQPQVHNAEQPRKKGKSLKMFALGALAVIAIALVVGLFIIPKVSGGSGTSNSTSANSAAMQQASSTSSSENASSASSNDQSQNTSNSQSAANSTSSTSSSNNGSASTTSNNTVSGDRFDRYNDGKKTTYEGALLLYEDGTWFYFKDAKGDVAVFSKNKPTDQGNWYNNPKWDNVITMTSASSGKNANMAFSKMDNGEQVLNEIDDAGKAKADAPRYIWLQKITRTN